MCEDIPAYKGIEVAFWDIFSQAPGQIEGGKSSRRSKKEPLFFHHLAARQVLSPGFYRQRSLFYIYF